MRHFQKQPGRQATIDPAMSLLDATWRGATGYSAGAWMVPVYLCSGLQNDGCWVTAVLYETRNARSREVERMNQVDECGQVSMCAEVERLAVDMLRVGRH